MNNNEVIINRVAQSNLLTLNLEEHYPNEPTVVFDLKDFLFMGLILKEKDFRAALKEHEWEQYAQKNVAIVCSADAIVPYWAYMLVASYLQPVAIFFAQVQKIEELHTLLFIQQLQKIDLSPYAQQRVVVKGCSDKPVPPAAYTEITRLLRPIAKSIMYGEPCSTVPIYKNAGM